MPSALAGIGRWLLHLALELRPPPRRKLPVLVGTGIQVVCLALLLYVPSFGPGFDMALCFFFGVGNAAHMLAFSTAGDVVEPRLIGTSSAIVNGTMFIIDDD
jgi:hypothetical protein